MAEPPATLVPTPLAPASPAGRKRRLVGALVVAGAAVVAYLAGTRSVPVPRDGARLQDVPARPVAPAFALPSLRGGPEIALHDFRGQVVVLNFFASWCKPCELEAADLQRTWEAVQGQGVVLLGIAMQDRDADAREFLARHGLTYPAAFDRDNRVADAYRITGIPTTVVVDPAGRIASRHVGVFVGDEGRARLRARIEAARRGVP